MLRGHLESHVDTDGPAHHHGLVPAHGIHQGESIVNVVLDRDPLGVRGPVGSKSATVVPTGDVIVGMLAEEPRPGLWRRTQSIAHQQGGPSASFVQPTISVPSTLVKRKRR